MGPGAGGKLFPLPAAPCYPELGPVSLVSLVTISSLLGFSPAPENSCRKWRCLLPSLLPAPGSGQAGARLPGAAVRDQPHPTLCTVVGQGPPGTVSWCHPSTETLPHPSASSLPWGSTRGQELPLHPTTAQGPAVPQESARATLSPWPGSHQPARPCLLPGRHGSQPSGYLNLPEIAMEPGASGGRAGGGGPVVEEGGSPAATG